MTVKKDRTRKIVGVLPNKKIISALLIFLSLSMNVVADDATTENSSHVVTIANGSFRAGMATYDEFKNYLLKGKKDNSKISLIVSDIKNYSLEITENETSYSVSYLIDDMGNETVVGGGAVYTVSKKDFKIIDRKYYE